MNGPETFAAAFIALYVAHQVADHWVQTDHQAATKGQPGWAGRVACAGHVATYTITALISCIAVGAVCGVRPDWAWHVLAGLAISAITHYIADRRTPLRRLAQWTGHGRFFSLGAPREGKDDNPSLGTGAYALDQSYHYLWLFVAALVIAA
jgi:hypothetical protein